VVLTTEDHSKTTLKKVKGLKMVKTIFTAESLIRIKSKVKERLFILTLKRNTKEVSLIILLLEKENTHGLMEMFL
jgi:hypothetical protein